MNRRKFIGILGSLPFIGKGLAEINLKEKRLPELDQEDFPPLKLYPPFETSQDYQQIQFPIRLNVEILCLIPIKRLPLFENLTEIGSRSKVTMAGPDNNILIIHNLLITKREIDLNSINGNEFKCRLDGQGMPGETGKDVGVIYTIDTGKKKEGEMILRKKNKWMKATALNFVLRYNDELHPRSHIFNMI